MEIVAPPIREAHCDEAENGREVFALQKAGRRKSGIVAVGLFELAKCSMHCRRTGASMVACLQGN